VFAVIAAPVLFFVLKKLFDREFAFFFTLFVPRFIFVFPLHAIGLAAIAALLYALEKRTVKSFVLLFLSVVFLALYEVPTGLSYGGGSFLLMFAVLVADFVKERRAVRVKKFLLSFAVFVAACAAVFAILCFVQGVHPFKRALEFLGLCLSANNWAYSWVGDGTSRDFALMYALLPVAAITGSVWAIINFRKNNKYAASLALFIAYFMNYSRALGRHSLAENQYAIVVWTCVLALMFLFAAIKPKIGKQLFAASGMALMLLFGVSGVYEYKSTLQHAYGNVISPATYRDGASEKVTRVNLSAPFEAHREVIDMLNAFVPQGETYMDLSSQTMLYALTGREKPVYVNQSPLHLSGEFTQKMFIEQIEKFGDKCNYALLGLGWHENLDGILNQYRYYYVYEYLYENYRPLCKTSTMFLWVKKDTYNDAVQKLSAGNSFAFEPIDYTYRDASYHTYNLGEIPYLWGTYDNKKAYENAVVTAVTDGLIPASKQSRSNYILLTLNADAAEAGTLVLADINGTPLVQYGFTLHGGTNRYMFRVSSDWYWANGQDVHVDFQTPANAQGKITLLAGD
jgi:hypothetical protein